MTFPYTISGVMPGAQDEHIKQLEALIEDLKRFAATSGPRPDELASAPLLSAWSLVPDPTAVRMLGHVRDHPVVGPGSCVTSRIVAIDSDAGWTRTVSRLWRLGPAMKVVRHH